jgi:hypothetical protein
LAICTPGVAAFGGALVLKPVDHLYKDCEGQETPAGHFRADEEIFMNYEEGCHEAGHTQRPGWNHYFPFTAHGAGGEVHADKCLWQRPVALLRTQGGKTEVYESNKLGSFQGNGAEFDPHGEGLPPGDYSVVASRITFHTPVFRESEFQKFQRKEAKTFQAKVICGEVKLELGQPNFLFPEFPPPS